MKLRTVVGVVVIALTVGVLVMPSSSGAVKAGTSCKKAGLQTIDSGRKYTCVKQGKKFVWNKGVLVKAAPASNPSPSAIPSASPSATPTPTPTPTPTKTFSPYEVTKIKAYENIRTEAEKDGSKNINLVYRISDNVPPELSDLYKRQASYSSKLYGTFFNELETMNIYVYTEKDQEFLKKSDFPRMLSVLSDVNHWFVEWEAGRGQEHVLGGPAWFYRQNSKFEGHAGVFVQSKSSVATHRKYAIQVLPHEYFHVVQDYFIQRTPKWTDQNSYDVLFAPIFREGSANTISFALSNDTKESYLDLYSYFINEKKRDSSVQLFSTLTSKEAVVKALYSMRTRATSADAHESSYSVGSLLFEWVIAEYGFDAYRKIVVNQQVGNSFGDNIQASLGISEGELYEKAAPHILAAFNGG